MSALPDDHQTDPTEPQPTGSNEMTSHDLHSDTTNRPDQPLHDPLPYGTGFADPQGFGYGVAPAYGAHTGYGESTGYGASPGYGVAYEPATDAVARRERSGSPVLAVAGLLSLGVAVWAILGAPVITTTVVITASLVLLVLVGLAMVIRR